MMTTCPYQHRMQYRITPADYQALHTRLADGGTRSGGAGYVHTLRFTNYRSYVPATSMQRLYTVDQSEPHFSLHYFDNDPTYLFLERRQDQTSTSAMVAEAECRALLSGETDWLLDRHNPVLADFHNSLTNQMLLPQVLLTYYQEVYTLDSFDLRVSLRSGLHTSLQHMDFLDPELLARDTAGQEGQILMEISYSTEIPDDLLCLLEETAPRRKLLA